jgi:hypothetical protein
MTRWLDSRRRIKKSVESRKGYGLNVRIEAKDLEKEINAKPVTESSPWDKRSRIGEWKDTAQAIYSKT